MMSTGRNHRLTLGKHGRLATWRRLWPAAFVAVAVAAAPLPTTAPTTAPTTSPTDDPKTLELPSFGLTIPVPDGYTRALEPSAFIACRYDVLDAGGTVQQVVAIAVTKRSAGETIEAGVRSAASKAGGIVSKAKWGGTDAFVVTGDPAKATDKLYDARKAYADRDGHVYVLAYVAVPGHADTSAFDAILAHTVWTKRTGVADAVRPRGKPVTLAGGIMGDLPDPLRRKEADHQADEDVFVATNLNTGKVAVAMVHLYSARSVRIDVDRITARNPIDGDRPVTWTKTADGRTATSSIAHQADGSNQVGVITVAADNAVHRFTFVTNPGTDAKAAADAARILADSFAPAK